jgi:hypothetical protein
MTQCATCQKPLNPCGRGRPPTYCSRGCRPKRVVDPKPKASRICVRCDAEFETHNPLRKWCSRRCNDIARGMVRAEPIPERVCALGECDMQFRPNREAQRCCSEKHGKLLCNREGRASGRYAHHNRWTDARRDNYHRRRARKRSGSTGDPVRLAGIAERDAWKCHLCGLRVDRRLAWPDLLSATLDHVVPLAAGGLHDPINVRLAHLTCNSRKGARPANEQLLLFG